MASHVLQQCFRIWLHGCAALRNFTDRRLPDAYFQHQSVRRAWQLLSDQATLIPLPTGVQLSCWRRAPPGRMPQRTPSLPICLPFQAKANFDPVNMTCPVQSTLAVVSVVLFECPSPARGPLPVALECFIYRYLWSCASRTRYAHSPTVPQPLLTISQSHPVLLILLKSKGAFPNSRPVAAVAQMVKFKNDSERRNKRVHTVI